MRRFLPFEQVVRTVGQLQQLDAFLNVGLVGGLVRRDVAQEAVLLGAPLGRLAVKEGSVDPAIKLVQVHRVDAVLESAVFGLEARDSLIVERLLVDVALTQRRYDPVQDLLGEGEASQQLAETCLQNLLPRVGLRALSLVASAVIVDVLPLLQLAHHGAAAVPTLDQVAEGKVAANGAGLRPVAPIDNILCLRPEFTRDDWLVLAGVRRPVEVKIAAVDPIAENLVDGGGWDGQLALGVLHAVLARELGDLLQRVLACRVPLKYAPDDRRQCGVGSNRPLAVLAHHVEVAERRERRPDPLAGLLQHPLLRFLRQVVDVVLGHQHLDAVHELLRGARVPGNNDVLLHEMDFEIQFIERHPVLEVAVEAVRLLDEQDAAGLLLPEEREHLAEASAASLLGGFHVDELLQDGQVSVRGVPTQQLDLGRNRESFSLLVLRGDAGVKHRGTLGNLA